jgi:hypothetical protein
VLGAIPDTYFAGQLVIDDVDSYDTDFDGKWRHGCRNERALTDFLGFHGTASAWLTSAPNFIIYTSSTTIVVLPWNLA